MIKTFTAVVKYLEQYIPTPEKKHPGSLGLSRMKYLMDLLGNPQLKYPTIHVGGTSGKGSTSTIIASILAIKYKVGLHTSPHLVKISERIKILIYGSCRSRIPTPIHLRWDHSLASPVVKTNDISDKDFIYLVNYLKPYIEKVKNSKYGQPSYFEIVTAMAFLHFYRQKVDIAVVEVGMGGRYDATNVIKPLAAVLTNVGLDHTEILGDTVEKITEDKVGIIKPRIQVVSGVRQPSVIQVLKSKIKNQRSKLSLLGRNFGYKIKNIGEKGSVFDYKGFHSFKNLKINLLGEHQVENAALAIRVIELMAQKGSGETFFGDVRQPNSNLSRVFQSSLSEDLLPRNNNESVVYSKQVFKAPQKAHPSLEIRKGLLNTFIPGRLEIISKKPLVILDGAHNPDKVKALVTSITKIFPRKKVTAIIAIKEDKNAQEMLEILLPICQRLIFTGYKIKADQGIIKSYSPDKLLGITKLINIQHRYSSRDTKVVRELFAIGNAGKALEAAEKFAKSDDIILVTGSLYLVGEVRKFLISNS